MRHLGFLESNLSGSGFEGLRVELAAARDALLEADLQDIERHIAITAELVGDDHSIVQGRPDADSAVATLRATRHMRTMAYRDLMRFGDAVEIVR